VTYAVVPVLVAALCVWLGRRVLTLVLIMAYLAVEGFLKLLSNYHPVVHVGLDIVVLSVAGAWLVDALLRRRISLPALPWIRLTAFYGVWIVLQLANPHSPGLLPSLGSFKIHLAMIPLYLMTYAVLKDRRGVMALLTALVAIAMVPAATALLQYALGPQSVLDLSPRYWQNIAHFHEWRPFGTSATPGGAAVFGFLTVPLAMVLLAAPRELPRQRAVALLSIALSAGTFVVSGGRQIFLGCLLALFAMVALAASRGRGRALGALLLVLTLVGGSYVAVATFLEPMAMEAVARDPRSPRIWREVSVTERLLTLAETETYASARTGGPQAIWERAARYPLGAGLGRTGSAAGAFSRQIQASSESARVQQEVGWSDNFFADLTVEAGVPGMLMLTTILIGMTLGAARLARRASDPLVITGSAAIAGLFFAYFVMSWGSQPLLTNPLLAYFWMLCGVLAALRRVEAESAAQAVHEDQVAPQAAPALMR
jgi:hypothetical protein